MSNFRSTNDRPYGQRNRDDKSFGRGNYGETNLGPKAMHNAICNKCSRDCQVPFRPNGRKPVLCSDCFRDANSTYAERSDNKYSQRQSFGSKTFSREPDRNSNHPAYKEQFEAINIKLDKILSLITTKDKSKSAKKTSNKIVAF